MELIETSFDVPFIANLALREKQIQQNYRPIIAIHKWFARRPGTLFRGLLLSEFSETELREAFYRGHRAKGLVIADPFMGGGTPLIEANRLGCDVIGYDVNPMAYWIVRQELEELDLVKYREAAQGLRAYLAERVGQFYRTKCLECGSSDASVKYFLWVKTLSCAECGTVFDLFPGYLLAENRRHPAFVLICHACGELNEVENPRLPGECNHCSTVLRAEGSARRNRCVCPKCGEVNGFPDPRLGPPIHRMVAIEYYCEACKPTHKGRFFKKPDQEDLGRLSSAVKKLIEVNPAHVPEDAIPLGDETNRLLRWGYRTYAQMFNPRQLLGLELSCRFIEAYPETPVRHALATNLSDLLRYQNMLCRYDSMALKSLDVFSVHGFPVGLMQCESNLLGIPANGGAVQVGSGGWSNIVEKYGRAKEYCTKVFETRHDGERKVKIPIPDEWIGRSRAVGGVTEEKGVDLRCASATTAEIPEGSIDGVFTDPPYFTNVQYAELMDFCYVWLRKLVTEPDIPFQRSSTRNENELTGNVTMDRGIVHFTEGLSDTFKRMAKALKPGRPLVFTYHHNSLDAYSPVAVAILDSKLGCSGSIPCPAEMGASIHINGTGSSIVDTVFVCRSFGTVRRSKLAFTPSDIARLVRADLQALRLGGVKLSKGDIRCVAYGHLVRMAIWNLRKAGWASEVATKEKLASLSVAIDALGGYAGVAFHLSDELSEAAETQDWTVHEDRKEYDGAGDEVSF